MLIHFNFKFDEKGLVFLANAIPLLRQFLLNVLLLILIQVRITYRLLTTFNFELLISIAFSCSPVVFL